MIRARFLLSVGVILSLSIGCTPRYAQDFDRLANGTTNMGDGTTLIATQAHTAQVTDGRLRLTAYDVFQTETSFHIPALEGSSNGFIVSFDFEVSALSSPADGFSFSYGPIGPTDATNGTGVVGASVLEHGYSLGSNATPVLAFGVDTFEHGTSGATSPGFGIWTSGEAQVPVVEQNVPLLAPGKTAKGSVKIVVRPDGSADFTTTGGFLTQASFSRVATGFVLNDAFNFAISARTGGFTEDVFIDNIVIMTGVGNL